MLKYADVLYIKWKFSVGNTTKYNGSFFLSCSPLKNIKHMKWDSDFSLKKESQHYKSTRLQFFFKRKNLGCSSTAGSSNTCKFITSISFRRLEMLLLEAFKMHCSSQHTDMFHDFCICKMSVSRFAKEIIQWHYKKNVFCSILLYMKIWPNDLHEKLVGT